MGNGNCLFPRFTDGDIESVPAHRQVIQRIDPVIDPVNQCVASQYEYGPMQFAALLIEFVGNM